MKTVAIVPIKLNNQRLPQKNTKSFTNGKPLCHYILTTLLRVKSIDEIYVYCSDPYIQNFIPEGVQYLQRSHSLDRDSSTMNEILKHFAKEIQADTYVLTHTTAPFLREESISRGIDAVLSGRYDSAFAAKKLQVFLWENGRPFNYELTNIPRTQDLAPLYSETCGLYIYQAQLLTGFGRRIGERPFIIELDEIESLDINGAEDFIIADAVYNHILRSKES